VITLTDLPERLLSRIVFDGPIPSDPLRPIDTPCWFWTGWHNSAGYGYVHWEGRDQPVHRVLFVLLTGHDLTGMDRDHVCRVVACIRPDHGECVPHAENMSRMGSHQKACRRAGHDYSDPRNVAVRPNGRRYCKECARQDMRARHARKRKASA
jgi:hypothetical protein